MSEQARQLMRENREMGKFEKGNILTYKQAGGWVGRWVASVWVDTKPANMSLLPCYLNVKGLFSYK